MLGSITTFASRFAGQGRRLSIAWERLFDRFERPRVAAAKDGLPLWAPATFVNDSRAEGGTVEAIFALVLDFDHGGRIDDAVAVDGHITDVPGVARAIDDFAAADDEVVGGFVRREGWGAEEQGGDDGQEAD